MERNKYTPQLVIEDGVFCSIPLYQRLFEWGEGQIEKLLSDALAQFKKDSESPYYIGMLTAHKNTKGQLDLVDGQQRFTLLTLLAIAYGWNDFVCDGDRLRLSFYARPEDEKYIGARMNNSNVGNGYINRKMEKGIECIQKFIGNLSPKDRGEFNIYLFHKLTFFIYDLPKDYQAIELNKYFETMNSAGRALENHEILKVDLLKKTDKKVRNAAIWNAVEQMDKFVNKQKSGETNEAYRERYVKDISNPESVIESKNEKTNDRNTIADIPAIRDKPQTTSHEVEGKRSILNFSEFLLLVLDIQLGVDGKYEFHRTDKLLETFQKLGNERVDEFFDNLLLYKLLFDFYIVKIQTEQSRNAYDFEYFPNENSSNDSADNGRKCLIQFQSMLYVSTLYYNWLKEILVWLKNCVKLDLDSYLSKLKQIDNNMRTFNESHLSYGIIDRYWFWRLDYYLWEAESLKGSVKDNNIFNYSFRTNRSIEHLHPRDQSENTQWQEGAIHAFGNLAMISQSFNSTQSNAPVNVKFARIESQGDKLESIKMYKMYQLAKLQGGNWNIEMAEEHEDEMVAILRKSFEVQ